MSLAVAMEKLIKEYTLPGGRYPVEERSINGINYRALTNIPETLGAFFEKHLSGDHDVFLVYRNEVYSFDETYRTAAKIAHILVSQYGVTKGDRVAIAMRNYPEWIFTYVAVTSIGAIVVPLNAWWKGNELKYALKLSGAKLVVADVDRVNLINQIEGCTLPSIVVRSEGVDCDSPDLEYLISGVEKESIPSVEVSPEDDASILFTSGSSGQPKGAVSSHIAILSTVYTWSILSLALSQYQADISSSDQAESKVSDPCILLTIPLFHVTGCNAAFVQSVLLKRKIVMMHKWDVQESMRLIEREAVTNFIGVPSMSAELVQAKNRSNFDLSSLVDIHAGGAPRPKEHVKQLAEIFPNSPPSVGYGLTETSGLGAINGGPDYLSKSTSVGKPTMPLIELKLVGDDGLDVAQGSRGEVCIKSITNVRGYWNDGKATAGAFDRGWFRTGDIGLLDAEGFLYVVGRKKEIIIRGGENISCIEVEDAVYAHENVKEASVFGIPDDVLGEVVVAVVLFADESPEAVEDLREQLAKEGASFKVPKHIWSYGSQLPKLASGKVFKRQLRQEFLER